MRLNTLAFPSGDNVSGMEVGMKLRDYFAVRVLTAVHPENVAMNEEQLKTLTEYAYRVGDAMLVARED